MSPKQIARMVLTLMFALCAAPSAIAAPIPLTSNAVIIDNAPFYSVGPEDSASGIGNFALNHPNFIDIPYAIFDFGAAGSVASAMLTWNFGSLYGGSGPAMITLYVGNDADGVITTGDRFMGTAVTTALFAGGELFSVDVTALVNAALASGQFFAARLEATVAPGSLTGYYGGNFLLPALDAVANGRRVPEPATLLLLSLGLAGFAFSRRRRP